MFAIKKYSRVIVVSAVPMTSINSKIIDNFNTKKETPKLNYIGLGLQ